MAKSTNRPVSTRGALRRSQPKPALPQGYGALRGEYVVRPGMDLTKPIYEQHVMLERKERRRKPR